MTAHQLVLASGLELDYAVFNGLVAISTSLSGLAAVVTPTPDPRRQSFVSVHAEPAPQARQLDRLPGSRPAAGPGRANGAHQQRAPVPRCARTCRRSPRSASARRTMRRRPRRSCRSGSAETRGPGWARAAAGVGAGAPGAGARRRGGRGRHRTLTPKTHQIDTDPLTTGWRARSVPHSDTDPVHLLRAGEDWAKTAVSGPAQPWPEAGLPTLTQPKLRPRDQNRPGARAARGPPCARSSADPRHHETRSRTRTPPRCRSRPFRCPTGDRAATGCR